MSDEKEAAEIRKTAFESTTGPMYAVAGLADALAEALKGAVAEVQEKGREQLGELQSHVPELREKAESGVEDIRSFVITLPEQVKHLPESTRARLVELQEHAKALSEQLTAAYGEYAERGKKVVESAAETAKHLSDKVTGHNGDVPAAAEATEPAAKPEAEAPAAEDAPADKKSAD